MNFKIIINNIINNPLNTTVFKYNRVKLSVFFLFFLMSCLISSCTSEMIDIISTKPSEIIETFIPIKSKYKYYAKLCGELRYETDFDKCIRSI